MPLSVGLCPRATAAKKKALKEVSMMQDRLQTELSAETLPAEVVDFVPGEFGLQLPVCHSNHPEALHGVLLQGVHKAGWHWREGSRSRVTEALHHDGEGSGRSEGLSDLCVACRDSSRPPVPLLNRRPCVFPPTA